MAEAGARPRWVSSARQLADGLTKESATQFLADRLRTHRNRLVADVSYEAARKKDPSRRHANPVEFASSKAQALGAALCASFITPANASSLDSGSESLAVNAFLIAATILMGLVILKLLWTPWNRDQVRILRDSCTQTEGMSVTPAKFGLVQSPVSTPVRGVYCRLHLSPVTVPRSPSQ